MKNLIAIAFLCVAGCRGAPVETSYESIRSVPGGLERRHVDIERHIAYLADDALEGRDSGTEGGRKAEEYILSQFRSIGLEVDEQPVEFVAGARPGPASSLAVDGKPLAAGSFQPYPFSANATGEWPAVFAGYGISAPDLGHDSFAGLDVKGKAVVVLAGSPDQDSPHGKFAAHQGGRAKALLAQSRGAAAVLVLHPVSPGHESLPPFGGEEVTRDAGIPVMMARAADAASPLGIDVATETAALAQGKAAARALDRRLSLRTDVIFERRSARNILGWLRGRAPDVAADLIVIGAHHDHLGRGGTASIRPERRGEIHNGADDNASGVAGLLELARRLRSRSGELRRSLLFITFAAEERGLIGSKKFAESPLLRIPAASGVSTALRPVAMINLDMVGRMRDRKLLVSGIQTSDAWPAFVASVERARAARGAPPLKLSFDQGQDLFGASDHLSFYAKGLPVLFFFTGTHREYHTPDDDLYRTGPSGRERLINIEGIDEVVDFVEEAVVQLAAMEPPPKHKPGVDLSPRMSFKVVLRLMPDYGAEVAGMRIADVSAGGPAARAGLQAGDVVVRFGSTPVKSVRDYMVGLEQARPGEEIEVEYLRGAELRTTKVLPSSPAR